MQKEINTLCAFIEEPANVEKHWAPKFDSNYETPGQAYVDKAAR